MLLPLRLHMFYWLHYLQLKSHINEAYENFFNTIKNFVENKDHSAAKTLCQNTNNPISIAEKIINIELSLGDKINIKISFHFN